MTGRPAQPGVTVWNDRQSDRQWLRYDGWIRSDRIGSDRTGWLGCGSVRKWASRSVSKKRTRHGQGTVDDETWWVPDDRQTSQSTVGYSTAVVVGSVAGRYGSVDGLANTTSKQADDDDEYRRRWAQQAQPDSSWTGRVPVARAWYTVQFGFGRIRIG